MLFLFSVVPVMQMNYSNFFQLQYAKYSIKVFEKIFLEQIDSLILGGNNVHICIWSNQRYEVDIFQPNKQKFKV